VNEECICYPERSEGSVGIGCHADDAGGSHAFIAFDQKDFLFRFVIFQFNSLENLDRLLNIIKTKVTNKWIF
jgi:hypothetical protein